MTGAQAQHRAIRSLTKVNTEYHAEHQVNVIDLGNYGFIRVDLKEFTYNGRQVLRYLLGGVNMKGPRGGRFPGRWVNWQERLRETGDVRYISSSGHLQLLVTDSNTDLLCEILDESITQYLEQRNKNLQRDMTPQGKFISLVKRCKWCSLDPDGLYVLLSDGLLRLPICGPICTDSNLEAVLDTLADTPLTASIAAAFLAMAEREPSLDRDEFLQMLDEHPDASPVLLEQAQSLSSLSYEVYPATHFSNKGYVDFQIDEASRKIHLNTSKLFDKRHD